VAADSDDIATAAVFRALADTTRRQILQDLRKGELAAGDIASRFPISGPSISRHLAVLKAAGLLTERRQANRVIYSLVPDRLALSVGSFLSAVCPEETLARHQGKKKPKAPEKASAKSSNKPSGKSADKASGKSADKDKRRRALGDPAPALAGVGAETTAHLNATV
jgi:DNA-binding transcriptional ArsR family regulator